MVCTANDLQGWKDFPKGLRVLLLDEDNDSAAEIRSKLEEMDYIVSTFCNEREALSAISSKPESFHVAIVEVNESNSHGSFKFLETAKDLPTIMTSNIHCLSTMMKCIALGAVEFLRKPLSEDKLRNIWQHVVHKAFNAGGSILSESLKPVKASVVSMLQIQLESGETEGKISIETETMSQDHEHDHEKSAGNDKYPAPSTPQLKQIARLLDDGDCHDQTICSTEKESREQDGESKSVETTCDNSMADVMGKPQKPDDIVVKEENDSADGFNKDENTESPRPHIKDRAGHLGGAPEDPSKAPGVVNSCGSKASKKKSKVDWTPELHKKFVQAVEQLGVDQAIPSRILELMKVDGLTRHNVASHLQKYRMQRRHILPKEDDRRWPHPRDSMQRNYYPQKPIMAYPLYHPNSAIQTGPVYPVWGAPSSHQAGVHMWGPPGYPPWQSTESWHWKPYPGMHVADAWGCPVMPQPNAPSPFPQNAAPAYHSPSAVGNCFSVPQGPFDLQPAEEVIDKVVKEAINMPWLPLPLGLKPPATDSVLAELSRQGISTVPPPINGTGSC